MLHKETTEGGEEGSAVMEGRDGAMEGKEARGRRGNLLFYDTSDLVTDECISNM